MDKYQINAVKSQINTVVSAGAGSGKTTVLSERFNDLIINRGLKVDQILTLTFTKKATVEMSSRIYNVLKNNAKDAADDFYKSSIKTIDSYCNSIAKTGAHLYGITPDFIQDEDLLKEKIKALSLPYILKHRDNEAVKALIDIKNYEELTEKLFVDSIFENSTVVSPIDFYSYIDLQIENIIDSWKDYTSKISALLQQYINAFNDLPAGKSSADWYLHMQTCALELIPQMSHAPILTKEDIINSNYEPFIDYIRNIEFITSYLPHKKTCPEGNELTYALRDFASKTQEGCLYPIINFIYGYKTSIAVLPLLDEFQKMVNDLKRTSGILSFSDIADIALKTLIEYPQIRLVEKKKYKAIMIDEFQDNNKMQRDLLFLLAEKEERMEKSVPTVDELCPDKLFFVGDEKQSIYRFRNADVTVFRSLSNEFPEGNLPMTNNYRSKPALIAAFNTFFGGVSYPPENADYESLAQNQPSVFYKESMPSKAIPDYEAVYHNVTLGDDLKEKISNESLQKLYRPRIHIARYAKDQAAPEKYLTGKEAEAKWIADKIIELTTKGLNGTVYKYSDIAVIFKTYEPQVLLERMFLTHSIPYNTDTIKSFFADGPVNDIFNFLTLCVYKNDSKAYLQVLCSPFVNLTFNEADSILLLNKNPFEADGLQVLSTGSLVKFNHARDFYNQFKNEISSKTLPELITSLWYEQGYRYETMLDTDVSMYAKMYDLIFEMACRAQKDNLSLSAFLDDWKQYHSDLKKLEGMDIPVEQQGGVHLLSIHKSKGLEFKVVFIIDSNHGAKNETNDSPVYFSKKFGITINTPVHPAFPKSRANKFFEDARELETKMSAAELRRLTYVAVTRAIDEVYITHNKYSKEKESFKYLPYDDSDKPKTPDQIYQVLSPVINFYEDNQQLSTAPFDIEEIKPYEPLIKDNSKENELQKRQKVYENARIITKEIVPPKYINPSQLHKTDDESYQHAQFKIVENAPFEEITQLVNSSIPSNSKDMEPAFTFANFGTIAHAYMEALINKTDVRYSNREIAGLADNKQNIKKIDEICKKMQQQFLSTGLGKKAAESKWHKAEYSFRSRINGKIINGTIDLVFENEDNTFTIVDYKTNQTIEPELYFSQLACYRHSISKMLDIRPSQIKCYLYYLRFGKEVDITEECDKTDIENLTINVDTE
ncbi:MAG: UvrD-helicase domain-containing protein [Treponema sp.]|nr:UvrD-helicase domain-containing protein [Treponema sp.]